MFIASRYIIGLPAATTRARLATLVTGGGLHRASHTAYSHGLDALIRVGPLGDAPLVSKLVAVRFLEPVERDGVTTAGLRWEATGPVAGLFPVLDANLTLTPHGEDRTEFTLTGTYRAPFGRVGAALDKALLHCLATMTVAALLTELAGAIAHPAAEAEPGPQAAMPNPEERASIAYPGTENTPDPPVPCPPARARSQPRPGLPAQGAAGPVRPATAGLAFRARMTGAAAAFSPETGLLQQRRAGRAPSRRPAAGRGVASC